MHIRHTLPPTSGINRLPVLLYYDIRAYCDMHGCRNIITQPVRLLMNMIALQGVPVFVVPCLAAFNCIANCNQYNRTSSSTASNATLN